jgi:hypothetical protein
MISCLRSSSGIFPEFRAVYCDDGGTWSGSSLIKAGETFVDVYQSNGVTRWGDYSGSVLKKNSSPPEAWVSGCYGAAQSSENALNTWIAQITGVVAGIQNPGAGNIQALSVYPNPSSDRFNVEFILEKPMMVDITLVDVQGKTVKTLLTDMAEEGKNLFSFNKAVLSPGIYFLRIGSNNKLIANEKVIIQ